MKNTTIIIKLVSLSFPNGEELPISYSLSKDEALKEFYTNDYLKFSKVDSHVQILSIVESDEKSYVNRSYLIFAFFIPAFMTSIFAYGYFRLESNACLVISVIMLVYLVNQIYVDFFKK